MGSLFVMVFLPILYFYKILQRMVPLMNLVDKIFMNSWGEVGEHLGQTPLMQLLCENE